MKTSRPLSPYRQRKRDQMVQTILDTARFIMREGGVGSLTMQELARRLDMRAPSLYNYFSGIMEIYDTLFRLGFIKLSEYVSKSLQGVKDWREYARISFEGYFTFAMQNPELYQLCFERPVPGFVPSAESLQVSFGQLHESYRLAEELLDPRQTGLPAQQAVDLLIAIMHGITAMHMANEPNLPLGEGRFGVLIPAAMQVLEKAWS